MLHLLPKTVFALSFQSHTSISNSASDLLLSFVGFDRGRQIRDLSFSGFFPGVDAHRLSLLDVVDECFDQILVFFSVRWLPLCEEGDFNIGGVAFETWFLCPVGVTIVISGSAPDGTGPSLLLHLVFIPHGDVLDFESFFVIILRQPPSCNI